MTSMSVDVQAASEFDSVIHRIQGDKLRETTTMTWTKFSFKQEEIATFLERDDFPAAMREYLVTNDGVPISSWVTREFAVSDDGVWIEHWGSSQRGWALMFRYWHKDVWTKFKARRPSDRDDNWVDYDPTNKTTANFALGPLCRVWIDDSFRRLSPNEEALVKENIKDFLTKEFHHFEFAFPPYPEVVEFR